MKELKYKLTNDLLFKMLFVKYPDLLKRLVAELLGIIYDDIEQFSITNPEMPPETLGDKFCRLEINRHTPLSDKFCLHFFELKKLPPLVSANSGKELWLSLFNAKTEEDLAKIEAMEAGRYACA